MKYLALSIKRNYFPKQTEGMFEVRDNNTLLFKCYTLELPFIENQNIISCIPEGVYPIRREIHEKHGKCLRLYHVHNRSGILMHVANYYFQLKGCIAVGERLTDINNDGLKDVTSSRKTIDAIYDLLEDEIYYITIKS